MNFQEERKSGPVRIWVARPSFAHPADRCVQKFWSGKKITAPEAKDSISIISTRNWNYFASNRQPCADLIKVVTKKMKMFMFFRRSFSNKHVRSVVEWVGGREWWFDIIEFLKGHLFFSIALQYQVGFIKFQEYHLYKWPTFKTSQGRESNVREGVRKTGIIQSGWPSWSSWLFPSFLLLAFNNYGWRSC